MCLPVQPTFPSILRVNLFLDEFEIELFERAGTQSFDIKLWILRDESVVLERVGNGSKIGRSAVESRERLEEEEALKESIRCDRSHPPLPCPVDASS